MLRNRNVILCVLAVLSCSVYVQRPPGEAAGLPTSIYSLPERLLVLSKHGDIVWFTEIHDTNSRNILNLTHWIDSRGQMGIAFFFMHHPMHLGYLDLSTVEDLVDELNNIGYFSVTEETIARRIMKKRLGCLGFLFSEPVEWPRYELLDGDILDRSVYVSKFRFATFTHRLSYQVGEEERWPYVEELRVLSEGMKMIEKYVNEKSLDLTLDSLPKDE